MNRGLSNSKFVVEGHLRSSRRCNMVLGWWTKFENVQSSRRGNETAREGMQVVSQAIEEKG